MKNNTKWKYLDNLIVDYKPSDKKLSPTIIGPGKTNIGINSKNEKEVIIKSKYWKKISHIMNIGGIHYLNYMVSKSISPEIN